MNLHEVMDVNARSTPKGKAQLRSIELERAANGGIIASHRFKSDGGPYKESEQHTFGPDEGKKVLTHIAEHMGIKGDKDSAAGAAT